MKKTIVKSLALSLVLCTLFGCKIQSTQEYDSSVANESLSSNLDESTQQGDTSALPATSEEKETVAGNQSPPKNPSKGDAGKNQEDVQASVTHEPQTKEDSTPTAPPAPVPPMPEEPKEISITITIDCSDAIGFPDITNGTILAPTTFNMKNASTAFDALKESCNNNSIEMLYSETSMGKYIYKIGSLSEKDCGPTSGWTYTVNGKYVPKSADACKLKNNDVVKFKYVTHS